jgi:membrane protein implicated in regulation of membrane protease activity
VLFLIALLLAIFVLPSPWGLVALAAAAVVDVTEATVGLWWNRRRKARVGAETLVGRRALAVSELRPEGQVKLDGELWRARCAAGCDTGASVVVRALDGLTLEVEPLVSASSGGSA